jgi:hypothetical protein
MQIIRTIRPSMPIPPSDTHPKIKALQIDLLRKATPERKLEMMAELNASARMLALSGLRVRYPQASERELQRRLAGLLLGEKVASKVYGSIDDAA